MDIYTLIKHDHQTVKELLTCLKSLGNSEEEIEKKGDIFAFMRGELMVHSKAEERSFYARIIEKNKSFKDKIEHSKEEHAEVEELLARLSNVDKDTVDWSKTLHKLSQELEHHIMEEERDVFQLAQRSFTPAESRQIAEEMLAEKGKLQLHLPLAVAGLKMKEFVT